MSQSRSVSSSRQRQQNNPPIPQNKAQNKAAYIPQLSPQYKTPPPAPLSKNLGAGSYQANLNNEVRKPQLTIGQTIGLITIRLTRVENNLNNLKQSNLLHPSSLDEMNSNTEVLQSSNMFYDFPNVNNKEEMDAVSNRLTLVESSLKNLVKVENDLQTTKDLLFILMSKHEKYVLETNAKFEALQNEVNQISSSNMVVSPPSPAPDVADSVVETSEL